MRKIIIGVIAIAMSMTLFAGCGDDKTAGTVAPAEGRGDVITEEPAEETLYSLDFTLYNFTRADLTEIRISESTETDFGDNLLPDGYVLLDNGGVEITFPTGAPAGTTFDLYTNDTDGDSYEYYGIPLTELTELYLEVEFYADGSYNNLFSWN